MKDPTTFTVNVPHGNRPGSSRYSARSVRCRAGAPTAAPNATHSTVMRGPGPARGGRAAGGAAAPADPAPPTARSGGAGEGGARVGLPNRRRPPGEHGVEEEGAERGPWGAGANPRGGVDGGGGKRSITAE